MIVSALASPRAEAHACGAAGNVVISSHPHETAQLDKPDAGSQPIKATTISSESISTRSTHPATTYFTDHNIQLYVANMPGFTRSLLFVVFAVFIVSEPVACRVLQQSQALAEAIATADGNGQAAAQAFASASGNNAQAAAQAFASASSKSECGLTCTACPASITSHQDCSTWPSTVSIMTWASC